MKENIVFIVLFITGIVLAIYALTTPGDQLLASVCGGLLIGYAGGTLALRQALRHWRER